jgi:hypothetical protein
MTRSSRGHRHATTQASILIGEPAVLFTINKLYRFGMSGEELYEATRGTWVLGPRREGAELALAVYQGIVREVFRIHAWLPACTLPYRFRDPRTLNCEGRWEFEGTVASDIRSRYVDKWVGKGGQNPVRYVNV